MATIYDEFPYLENEFVIIKKMSEEDVDDLMEITNNDNVYKYVPLFLFKKSRNTLITAIRNLGSRDFEKKKMIIAGVYLTKNPKQLIGLAEMFDYKAKANQITVGYRLNEKFWHQGVTTNVVSLMKDYFINQLGISTLKAFVIPENIYSAKALLKNGFVKENQQVEEHNWGGKETVLVDEYTGK